MKQKLLKLMCLLCVSMMGMSAWAAEHNGTIVFNNTGNAGTIKINAASVSGEDNLGNEWTVTTAGTSSFTPNASYFQVGSSGSPATSITFTMTLPETSEISSMSAKFGGFSGTAGTVTLKAGDTTIGTGSLNATSDVTVTSTSTGSGKVLTVTVTGIKKGVKCYNISYTYTDSKTATTLVWSESSASAIIGESNTFPTLTTTPADLTGVTYSSSDESVATINATGVITILKKGTTTITASYSGNAEYLPAPDATYVLSVKEKF
ncbi:MAG: Ig-like domain-containing protein, partial [Bacteroidaceae bacterium]|nr:Ig-like domain-containing protein [Bacteroidaceae bacterium]